MPPKFAPSPETLAACEELEPLVLEFAAAIRADWGYCETLAKAAYHGRRPREVDDNAA